MTRGTRIRDGGALAALGAMALLLASGDAAAQSKVGTTIGQFLGIEPSARHAGMGNAGVGLYEGIESVYFNPGALGVLDRPAISFTHAPWFADITYDYAAAAFPVGRWGTLFGSVTSLTSGEIDVRTVEQPLGTGEKYDVGDLAVSLGFGRTVTSRFSTGLQVSWVRERIWHTAQDFVTFGVGTVYRLTDSGIRLGSGLSNMGTRARFSGGDLAIQYDADPDLYGDNSALPSIQYTDEFPVPLLFRVGLSVPYEIGPTARMMFAVDALHPNDNAESVNAGAEWSWRETLAMRAGWQTIFQRDSPLGPTFGFGLMGRFGEEQTYRLDYAWAGHDYLDETHRFSLVLGL
jgi:hypothetical protein